VVAALVAALVGTGAGAGAGWIAGDSRGAAAPATADADGGSSALASIPAAEVAMRVLPTVVTVSAVTGGGGGTGSGVIISPDGYIVTNNHVLSVGSGTPAVNVILDKGAAALTARVVGRDPRTDLAVLKVTADRRLPAASLGDSSALAVGMPVMAIGSPLGLPGTVTSGVVSALDRTPAVPTTGDSSVLLAGAIQTDAPINPGNSGGPLVNAAGQVVGIDSALAVPDSTGAQSAESGSVGVGFAIPVDYVSSVADEIIHTGRATHPGLGVQASTVTPGEARALAIPAGALLADVTPGGPADRAGLRPGDTVTSVDGVPVRGMNDLIVAARRGGVGATVAVDYVRDGRPTSARVTLRDVNS
jgi:putative serine protease PepD